MGSFKLTHRVLVSSHFKECLDPFETIKNTLCINITVEFDVDLAVTFVVVKMWSSSAYIISKVRLSYESVIIVNEYHCLLYAHGWFQTDFPQRECS